MSFDTNNCITCGKANHPERVKMNMRECYDCSSTEKYGGVPMWGHKTGSEVVIVKDKATANRINKAFDRRNYGVTKGMMGKVN